MIVESEVTGKEFDLAVKACEELSGLGRRNVVLKFVLSERMKKSDYSVKKVAGYKTFEIRLRKGVDIEEVMPKVFETIYRRLFGTVRNLRVRFGRYKEYLSRLRALTY